MKLWYHAIKILIVIIESEEKKIVIRDLHPLTPRAPNDQWLLKGLFF